jgi:hypothetical protein
MDREAVHGSLRKWAWGYALLVAGQTATYFVWGAVPALVGGAYLLLVALVFWILTSRAVGDVFRVLVSSPVKLGYILTVIAAIALVPTIPVMARLTYDTGRFGEPPNNRFIIIHESSENRTVLEFGVRVIPTDKVMVVLKFDRPVCPNEDDIGGMGPPDSPSGPFRIAIGFSFPAREDPNVYIADASARITPKESAYYSFHAKSGRAVLQDCRFQGSGESFSEGRSCANAGVEVLDRTGDRSGFEPVPFDKPSYGVDPMQCE